jgi:imidazolonepropionase-like amidohydrolase
MIGDNRAMLFALAAGLCLLAPLAGTVTADDYAVIYPVSGPKIERGVLLVRGDKIESVGAVGSVTIPADAKRVDLQGKVVIPGLVDTHSHVGGGDGEAGLEKDDGMTGRCGRGGDDLATAGAAGGSGVEEKRHIGADGGGEGVEFIGG